MFQAECTRGAPFAPPSPPPSTTAPPAAPAAAAAPSAAAAPPPEPAAGGLAQFKGRVREFVAADTRAKELAAELRAVRKGLAEARDEVCAFMADNAIEDLHTREMRLKLHTADVKAPLRKGELDERVRAFFAGDDAAADDFMERVFRRRELVSKTSLRRLKPRP